MSCCNACAESERRAFIGAIIGGGTTGDLPPGSTAGPAGDVYTGPPLTPEQICRARIYSSREHASGFAARDQRDCLERAAADIAAGRNGGAAPRMPSGNIWNARERSTPFRQRRSTQDRAPMPGREPAKPAPRPAAPAPRPAVPRPGGIAKGGPSPTPTQRSPFLAPKPQRAQLLNTRQLAAARAAVPKATQHAMRQAALAASQPPPGYEWAPATDPNAPPPGYEWVMPPDPYADPYALPAGYEWAMPAEPSGLEGMSIESLLNQVVAWIDGGDPAEMDLAAQVIAELTGGPVISGGPVTNTTVRAIDDVISSIWGGLRGIVPGGDAIDAVHQTRRELMYGPEGRTDRGRTSPGGPGGRLPAPTFAPAAAASSPGGSRSIATIAELQRLVRTAARGGPSSTAARDLAALKTAARGSADARRRWTASVAVMRDDIARIRAAAR